MIADIYDFDGTVFNGESGSEFYLFCLCHYPSLIKYIPKQISGLIRYKFFHKKSFDEMKETFYCFVKGIDADKAAEKFWYKNADKMNKWFKPKESDVTTVICSASPVFQIKPICDLLGVDIVIATNIDPKTGKLSGKNCKNSEKVERIKKEIPEYEIRDVYTDNVITDLPILKLATRNKFKVKNGNIEKYEGN
ncbi:MAG: haloacid dehalogenase-like hydrolase [Ruminococcus sp.]|nr:haloacid dehalogenase-like hydrolase [Candidatus Copronaster equi]